MARTGLALVALLSVLAAPATAEHEAVYRYIVLGYVKDARGSALPDRTVELIRDKTGFSYLAATDDRGFYAIIVRLGDESLGEKLTLRVGASTTTLTARFDPANRTEDRGTRVDLQGPRFVERPAWFRSTLASFLGAARR